MSMSRPIPAALVLATLTVPTSADAACGDGVIDPGETCHSFPGQFIDDSGDADHVLVGDFVGPDGLVDLVLVHERKGGNDFFPWIMVFPNDGVGLGAVVESGLAGPYGGARTPAVADFDGDGLDDLVFVERSDVALFPDWTTYVDVWLSNGNGTFTEAFSYFDYATAVDAGDFDGDGNADYVVRRGSSEAFWPPAGVSDHGLEIRLGDGLGGFSPERLPSGVIADSTTMVLRAADFNGDGSDDVMTIDDGELRVGMNYGPGGFDWRIWSVGVLPDEHLHVVDVDVDGALDIAFVDGGTLVVALGLGNGVMGQVVQSPLGIGAPPPGAVGDFDGDGLPDFVSTAIGGAYYMAAGLGAGSFGPSQLYADLSVLEYIPSAALAADLDGDGVPEHISTFRTVTPTLNGHIEWSNP
jgi:hypothetical protein